MEDTAETLKIVRCLKLARLTDTTATAVTDITTEGKFRVQIRSTEAVLYEALGDSLLDAVNGLADTLQTQVDKDAGDLEAKAAALRDALKT